MNNLVQEISLREFFSYNLPDQLKRQLEEDKVIEFLTAFRRNDDSRVLALCIKRNEYTEVKPSDEEEKEQIAESDKDLKVENQYPSGDTVNEYYKHIGEQYHIVLYSNFFGDGFEVDGSRSTDENSYERDAKIIMQNIYKNVNTLSGMDKEYKEAVINEKAERM